MSGANRRGRGMFVPLQANYFLDDAIKQVGNQGELAYLRSLAVAKLVDRDGVLTVHQLRPVSARIRSWSDVVDALLEHKLWVPAPTVQGYRIRSWLEHNESKVDREQASAQLEAKKRQASNRSPEVTVIDGVRPSRTGKRREEKREGSDRTPSGSVRSEPAPAARHDAGGAAPLAPGGPAAVDVVTSESDSERPPEMTPAEWAKAEAEKGRRNNPAAGRKFSYRPVIPAQGPTAFEQTMKRLSDMVGDTE